MYLVLKYRRPLLFADFLNSNLLIHIAKIIQNVLIKNRLFICEFKILGPKGWHVFTSKNEGYLFI